MIDFTGQAVIVTGAGRGLGRLYAVDLAARGASVGLAEGWLADPDSAPTADDIATHLAEVSATEPFTVPTSIFDEVAAICDRLGVTA
jgi:NAD(P)-dependent dehydrogenase (short-subunit alcohol dehydrogenase family)